MPREEKRVHPAVEAVREALHGHQESDRRTALSAREKMKLYIFTASLVAFIYLSPGIFALAKDAIAALATVPPTAWKAIFVLGAVAILGGCTVGAFAVWQVFRTGRLAIERNAGKH